MKTPKHRHSDEEIAAKLAQAGGMENRGMLQTDIARSLGISVMTYHRWRKARPKGMAVPITVKPTVESPGVAAADRLSALQEENTRLRRLVTDLLLEKVRLEETLERQQTKPRRSKAAEA
jgi:putative transposase